MQKRSIIIPIVALLIGVGIGNSSSNSATTATTADTGSAPTTTVTRDVAGPAGDTVTQTVTVAPKAPVAPVAPATAKITDGIWVVGEDIPAGTYKVTAAVDSNAMCYWSITKSGSNGDNIISNDLPKGGFPKVILKNGQDFNTQDCGAWAKR